MQEALGSTGYLLRSDQGACSSRAYTQTACREYSTLLKKRETVRTAVFRQLATDAEDNRCQRGGEGDCTVTRHFQVQLRDNRSLRWTGEGDLSELVVTAWGTLAAGAKRILVCRQPGVARTTVWTMPLFKPGPFQPRPRSSMSCMHNGKVAKGRMLRTHSSERETLDQSASAGKGKGA